MLCRGSFGSALVGHTRVALDVVSLALDAFYPPDDF